MFNHIHDCSSHNFIHVQSPAAFLVIGNIPITTMWIVLKLNKKFGELITKAFLEYVSHNSSDGIDSIKTKIDFAGYFNK